MEIKIFTAEQFFLGKLQLPVRGKRVFISKDDITFSKAYFVQTEIDGSKIEGCNKSPFICVDKQNDMDFPYTRGKAYGIMKVVDYTIDDVIILGGKFLTRDGLYETISPNNLNFAYWQRTNLAKDNGVEFIMSNQTHGYVYVTEKYVEKSVKILNKLLK